MDYLRRNDVLNELNKNQPSFMHSDGIPYILALSSIAVYMLMHTCTNNINLSIAAAFLFMVILIYLIFHKADQYNNICINIPKLMDKEIISISKYRELINNADGYLNEAFASNFVVVGDHSVDVALETEKKNLENLLVAITNGNYDKCDIHEDVVFDFLLDNMTNDTVSDIYWYADTNNLSRLKSYCNYYCKDNACILYFKLTKKQYSNQL